MTDELWKQKGFNGWQYGHGSPPSAHRREMGVPVQSMPSTFQGMNKLWGDGAVGWKDASEFDMALMGGAVGVPTEVMRWIDNPIVAMPY